MYRYQLIIYLCTIPQFPHIMVMYLIPTARGAEAMITPPEIEEFLEKVRLYIDNGKTDFILGKEEKYTLGKLGISIEDAFAVVTEITYENFYQGPTPDHTFINQEVMEFGIEDFFSDLSYPNKSLYLKLTFRQRKNDLLMMSFHPARHRITYPYGKDKLIPATEKI